MANNRIFLLALILILGAFFRFYNITTIPPGPYPDEAMNGNNAAETIATGNYKLYYPENNGREGLFINIQSFFLRFFKVHEPWVLRFPSAIFGTLTVLGMYLLARELFSQPVSETNRNTFRETDRNSSFYWGQHVALLSTFFLATSFWHINFSRIGFRAIMAPFFLVWSIYLLLLGLRHSTKTQKDPSSAYQDDSPKNRSNVKSLRSMVIIILSGLLFGLGFHTYIAYRVAPLIILVIMFGGFLGASKERRKKIITFYLLFIISALVTVAPIGLYYLENPQDFFGRTAQVSVFSSSTPLQNLGLNVIKTLGMFNFAGDWNWRHNFPGSPQLYWPVGIVFLIGIFLSLRKLFYEVRLRKHFTKSDFVKNITTPETILWTWFLTMMLPVVVSNEGIPHALRAIIIIPPIMIFAGIGAAHILNAIKTHLSSTTYRIIIAVGATLIISHTYIAYFLRWGQSPETYNAFSGRYAEIGYQLNLSPQDIDKYILVPRADVLVRGIPMPAQTVMFITDTFDEQKRKEKNIYYVTDYDQIPDDKKRKIVIPLEPK